MLGSHSRTFAAIMVIACAAGCSTFPLATDGDTSKSADRNEQREQVLATFEQKRNHTQFTAAHDQVEQGDLDAAEQLLTSLLDRKPDHHPARILLAEVWAIQDRAGEAEAELRQVLKQDPNNAHAHHAIGLLLDVSGRTEEAAGHFFRAAELAPENETYRISRDAAASTASEEPLVPGSAHGGVAPEQTRM